MFSLTANHSLTSSRNLIRLLFILSFLIIEKNGIDNSYQYSFLSFFRKSEFFLWDLIYYFHNQIFRIKSLLENQYFLILEYVILFDCFDKTALLSVLGYVILIKRKIYLEIRFNERTFDSAQYSFCLSEIAWIKFFGIKKIIYYFSHATTFMPVPSIVD